MAEALAEGGPLRVLVTGGAGFIGSALVRHLIGASAHEVLVIDALTYAGNLANLAPVAGNPRFRFVRADICDAARMAGVFGTFRPGVVVHLAAESHVDRSIDGPAAFVQTNLAGTFTLLDAALAHWRGLDPLARAAFRFHHVSTDEVFGALGPRGAFDEATAYDPRSPYSASKAGADHLVRAWHHTFGLPVLVTNCSNNYGPYHFPEKLIPLTVVKALAGEPLPVYGRGEQVRDWLHVDDHVRALRTVFERAAPGTSYMIGARGERTNLEVVEAVCAALDARAPRSDGGLYREQIAFVADRPGHDFRYAVDPSRIERELGWRAHIGFAEGIARTVAWYLENRGWWEAILSGAYRGERLGTA